MNWKNFDHPIGCFTGYHKANKGRFSGIVGKWNYGSLIDEDISNLPVHIMLDSTKFIEEYYKSEPEDENGSWTFIIKHLNGYYIYFDVDYDIEYGTILYSKNLLDLTKFLEMNSEDLAIEL